MSTRKHVGQYFKCQRKKRGLTAEEIARKADVARSCVYQWESRAYLKPKPLAKYAAALGISVKRALAHEPPNQIKNKYKLSRADAVQN